MKEEQLKALKKTMRPEFINRIDDIIIFKKLEKETLYKIFDILIMELQKRLKEKSITIDVTGDAKNYIVEKGSDLTYGARPLKRTIQRLIEDKLSEKIILKELKDGDKVTIDYKNEELKIFSKEE